MRVVRLRAKPQSSCCNARSVFVYAPKSDYILYAHHELTPLPLASLAKIMTATVALDVMDTGGRVLVDEEVLSRELEYTVSAIQKVIYLVYFVL